MRLDKYKKNLEVIHLNGRWHVYSYDVLVAVEKGRVLVQQGWWSSTTQKHINYAAKELGLALDRNGY